MFTMKQTCKQTQLSYETLKFYCNQGLVPNVKRDKNNHRNFDKKDIAWINSLNCLSILKQKRSSLLAQQQQIQELLFSQYKFPN